MLLQINVRLWISWSKWNIGIRILCLLCHYYINSSWKWFLSYIPRQSSTLVYTITVQLLLRFASLHQTGNDLQEDRTTCGSEPLNQISDDWTSARETYKGNITPTDHSYDFLFQQWILLRICWQFYCVCVVRRRMTMREQTDWWTYWRDVATHCSHSSTVHSNTPTNTTSYSSSPTKVSRLYTAGGQ